MINMLDDEPGYTNNIIDSSFFSFSSLSNVPQAKEEEEKKMFDVNVQSLQFPA